MHNFKKFCKPVLLILGAVVLLNLYGSFTGKLLKDDAAVIDEFKRTTAIEKYISMDSAKQNVMLFGSSELFSGINPVLFDSMMDKKTYTLNMGLLGLPINTWYFSLKRCIERGQIPQYVILGVGTSWVELETSFESYANEGISGEEFLSYLFYCKNKNFIFNYILPAHRFYRSLIEYPYYSIFDPEHFDQIRMHRKQLIEEIIRGRGFMVYSQDSIADDFFYPKDTPKGYLKLIDFKNDFYVKKFISLCKTNNIKIFAISSPMRRGKCKQFKQTPKEIAGLAQTFDNVYIKPGNWELKFYSNRFFCDEYHLNEKGSVVYTKEIAADFKATFGF
jgi:hypothetical protein